jgi:glycosyltransferase involved in cell wall biosynthesis
MTPEERYIQKLEHKIWLLETSKSYRLTSPLRKAEEIVGVARRLPRAARQFFEPGFREGFDVRAYLESSARPRGWWKKYPALHYCLFHAPAGEDDGKYDALDPAKPTVILVTHSVCRTGAPILVLDLARRFLQTHNVVGFSILGGALEKTFRETCTVFVGPIARSNLGFVLDQELTSLQAKCSPEFVLVNSIEAAEALDELWRHDLPILHLVHEFASYTRPRSRIEKSATLADAMIFSAGLVRDNSIESSASVGACEKHIFPQGLCALPDSLLTEPDKASERAAIRAAFRPNNWPTDTPVVLGAGTVQLRKGLHLFIACAKKVLEKSPELGIRFVWIGSGFNPETDLTYSCFIEEQIKRSGLGENFTLLNEVHELQCAYDEADIFFLSSKLDPLPLVAQDALFNKLPLVCFDRASGIPEHIRQDTEASVGVVPYLDVEAAADKIVEFARDKELRQSVGEAGSRLAARIFNQDDYFASLNRIGRRVGQAKRQEIIDREVIRAAGCFDVGYAYPKLAAKGEGQLALKYYTTSWRRGFHCRKPFPGFHPGIYADHNAGIARDPLAHFIEAGRPDGPWLSEVIRPGSIPTSSPLPAPAKTALHIHLHYPDVAGEIFSRLQKSRFQPDLFVSVTSDEARADVESQMTKARLRSRAIRVVPNLGRDIGPLFTGFPEIFDGGYEFLGHVHGKKSVNLGADFSRQWAIFLYENLLGGIAPMMEEILRKMQADPTIGFVFPDDPHVVGWEGNGSFASDLGERLGLQSYLPTGSINFPVGTMFWARPSALTPLFEVRLKWSDYPAEPLPYDGSLLHAMERILPYVAQSQGFQTAVTHVPGKSR